MECSRDYILKDNWLTQEPRFAFGFVLFFWVTLTLGMNFIYTANSFLGQEWMPASAKLVFEQHEYWRLWTSLFAHANLGHILSNLILFIPLTFLLTSYYGFLVPFFGILFGGIISAMTLKGMPSETFLIGISGVVSWMAGVWFVLYLFIDRRRSLNHRIGVVLFLTLFLFVPDQYKPEVSYMSHLIGYVLGFLFGGLYYFLKKSTFQKAEKWIVTEITDDDRQWLAPELNPQVCEKSVHSH